MSFLSPLYILGLLAVGLPIVFHLIRRQPKGNVKFSSLMFLRTSPPTLTRRSRLDNLLLLLLRAAAISLLAFAFARPFLRSTALLQLDGPARRTVVLLDTSASMRRDGVWQSAVGQINDIADNVGPGDQVSLVAFDESARVVVGFDEEGGRRTDLRTTIAGTVRALNPTWSATDLGRALISGCELLEVSQSKDNQSAIALKQLVLVTDLQAGSDLSALDAFEWPSDVRVDVRVIRPDKSDNVSVELLPTGLKNGFEAEQVRVRVANFGESADAFQLTQLDSTNTPIGRSTSVQVPPGESRIIGLTVPREITGLRLDGDSHDFDNRLYIAQPDKANRRLIYLADDLDDKNGLSYFLKRIDLNSAQRNVELVPFSADASVVLDPREVPLIVAGAELSLVHVDSVKRFLKAGGNVLAVLSSDKPLEETQLEVWRSLLEMPSLRIEPYAVSEYAILTAIDFDHPLFAPFATAKYRDFSKIRFWKHRNLSANHEQPWKVLAQFDNGVPALVELERGDGRLWVLTSGWHADDSQLGMSTKFVPLIAGMFDLGDKAPVIDSSLTVGQPLALPEFGKPARLVKPDGTTHDLNQSGESIVAKEPGVYLIEDPAKSWRIAANLKSSEGNTRELDLGQLEQRGVRLGKHQSTAEVEADQRQLRDAELEARQRSWKYLIVGALTVLGLETFLAGRRSMP